MQSHSLHDWIQTLAAVSVLIGVFLVVYELRQSREIVMSQLTNDSYFYESGLDLKIAGEEPAKALSRACKEPDSLTTEDLIRLEAIYSHRLMYVDRHINLARRGSFYEEDAWKEYAPSQFGPIFSTKVGQNYWRQVRQWMQKDLREFGDNFLLELEANGARCIYGDWDKANRTRSDDT